MELYAYQKQVARYIRMGRSVILHGPTGCGKFLAALWPYLEAWERNQPEAFPRTCIYSVPMRVLANQFVDEATELASKKMLLNEVPNIKIQTGERQDDERFTGDLIFATIDQTLSSALAVPYSLTPGLANLNAGAIFSAYLVFDEFHLFPVDENGGTNGALVTTLQLLTQLKGIVPFVLMTATFSTPMLAQLAKLLDAEVVQVSDKEYKEIAMKGAAKLRERTFHLHETPLNAAAIIQNHQERSIAICNQVKRAQELTKALREQIEDTETEVILLHSRFTAEDRRRKEEEIRAEFGKDQSKWRKKRLILVATQVVEVGLDITCQHLHTELAPANAILQRAGRCARFPGEKGTVHLYPVPLRQQRNGQMHPDYLPYPKALCEATWVSFTNRNHTVIGVSTERAIIDEVHTASDIIMLKAMARHEHLIWKDMYQALENHERALRTRLIREVNNITVLAAAKPEDVGNPYSAQGFGLFRGTVYGLWQDLQSYDLQREIDEPESNWLMAYPLASDKNPDDATEPPTIVWKEVRDESELNSVNLVVVNAAFCNYHADLGFRLVPPTEANGWTSPPGAFTLGNNRPGFAYQLESYNEHITRMLRIYRAQMQAKYAYVQRRLTAQWQLPNNGLDRAVIAAIACHDAAKLDRRWQRWVRLYQMAIGKPIADTYMAVHTDYAPMLYPHHAAAKKAADRQEMRPNHAGESALATASLIRDACIDERLGRAALTAIARHHSPHTHTADDYRLHPAAKAAITQAMQQAGIIANGEAIFMETPSVELEDCLLQPENFEQLLLYFYVVRALRQCDGLSQEGR